MSADRVVRFSVLRQKVFRSAIALEVGVVLFAVMAIIDIATAAEVKVLKEGLGHGTVTAAGITCGTDCDETGLSGSFTLVATANPDPDSELRSEFSGWHGCSSETGTSCTVTFATPTETRLVRAVFAPPASPPALRDRFTDPETGILFPDSTNFTPERIAAYLRVNPTVNSPARLISVLPREYRQNWILMTRSESLQTGTAQSPRILLPSADARFVFTVGMTEHSSYPGSHPNAIEFMQWDEEQKNFRFHEIVLATIPALPRMGPSARTFPMRSRQVSIDDPKCSKCHSTRNVLNLNRSVSPPVPGRTRGTDGSPAGSVQVKNKPNWDTKENWGGMLPFNNNQIFQGSVEAAAFRKIFNLWNWSTNDSVRQIIEELDLPATEIKRDQHDGHINFAFDLDWNPSPAVSVPAVVSEPDITGALPSTSVSYDFTGGTSTATPVKQGGEFVPLINDRDPIFDSPGRGSSLFDQLSIFNISRVVDELIEHRFATGSVPIDVRPIALAVARGECVRIDHDSNSVVSTTSTPLTVDRRFFDVRNGMTINQLVDDTRTRQQSLPQRRADIQKHNLARSSRSTSGDRDPYLYYDPEEEESDSADGLLREYGDVDVMADRAPLNEIRQEVFRLPTPDEGRPDCEGVCPDETVMGRIAVDREFFTERTMALFRYFLEPLGVSVDKWSMGVRGRSRTYTFANWIRDFPAVNLVGELRQELTRSLREDPRDTGLSGSFDLSDCSTLIGAVNRTLSALPDANAVPTYTDVQRIFNKSCVECHGGLGYPPYHPGRYPTNLDLSENESPPSDVSRLVRSYGWLLDPRYGLITSDPRTSRLYQRICPGAADLLTPDDPCPVPEPDTMDNENCPGGIMPCGGPRLSHADIVTIRRWIQGPPQHAFTEGDPHIKTVNDVEYDFQSAGEFTLLRDESLEVQTRQTPVETETPLNPNDHTGLSSCMSLNTAVAVRLGPHRITYQPIITPNGQHDPEGLQLRIDGKPVKMTAQGIPLPSGGRIISTTVSGGLKIEAPGGTVLIITPALWGYHQVWHLNIKAEHVRATEGIMGVILPQNWLPALPDGRLLGPRPVSLHQRYVDLYQTFADAWRVSDATSLFDYAPGISTKSFTLKSWPGESSQSCKLPQHIVGSPRKPPLKPLKLEEAQRHCHNLVAEDRRANCTQDVMVTGEPGFAQVYLATQKIEQNRVPTVPRLISPNNEQIGLLKTTVFRWKRATDPDGDPVTYRHCVWAIDTMPTEADCTVVSNNQQASRSTALFYAGLGGSFLLVGLLVPGIRNRHGLFSVVTVMIVTGFLLVSCSNVQPMTTADSMIRKVENLNSGKAYFWKVIADDDQGGSTESETWRFTVK